MQYLESLSNAPMLLETLTDITPVYDSTGNPIMSSGNFGTVFKVIHNGKPKALKCFTRDQPYRTTAYEIICANLKPQEPYIIDYQYFDNEITVFDDNESNTFPALLMTWVDGDTMTSYMRKAAVNRNKPALEKLSKLFDTMALWLLDQPMAHGDLKPDNIMIRSDGSMTLVDYDGIYLPQMIGTNQRELGTPEFQHPLRMQMPFSKAIDHYSIALISLLLKVLSQTPDAYLQFQCIGGTMLNPPDIFHRTDACFNYLMTTQWATSPLLKALQSPSPIIENLSDLIQPASDLCIPNKNSAILTPFKENNLYGFVNSHNHTVIQPIFEMATKFCCDLAAVKLNGRWGFVDTKGQIQIPPIYDYAGTMNEGCAVVSISGKFGYISNQGGILTPLRYDNAWSFHEGFGMVRKGGKYGFVDKTGKLIIRASFDFANNFNEGVACVMQNNLYGYINSRGRWVIQPQFTFARNIRNGKAEVEIDGHSQVIIVKAE